MAVRDQEEVPLWAAYLKDILEKMESNHVEMKFGLYFPDRMPTTVVIIAAFTSQNGGKPQPMAIKRRNRTAVPQFFIDYW